MVETTRLSAMVLRRSLRWSRICSIYIAPVAQRRGLGQAMLLHMLRVVQRHGALETFLEVRPSNQTARNLYARVGFKQVGCVKPTILGLVYGRTLWFCLFNSGPSTFRKPTERISTL